MKKLLISLFTIFCITANQSVFAAYPTTTEHHKLYPYTSIMASPYSGDPTGVIDCAAAIESIKVNQANLGTIYIPRGTFKIATNLTIPVGMSLEFASGASFSVSNGVTFTINCSINAGPWRIFTGAGTVVISPTANKNQYGEWIGANSATNYRLNDNSEVTLATTLAVIGSNPATLTLGAGTWSITINRVIPSNINLVLENGAILTIATTKTLTINSPLDAGLYQIFSCTNTGKVRFGAMSVKEVYPEWWGAKGDWDGTTGTDDYAAIQAALDSVGLKGTQYTARPVIFSRSYKINTCLNITNTRVNGTVARDGTYLKGSTYYVEGAKIIGNTGNLIIDASGCSFLKIEDLTIISNPATLDNPSVAGILCAPNTTLDSCQNTYFRNFTIILHDDAAANGGKGTVALMNFGAEDCTYDTCYFSANFPAIFTTITPVVGSIYETLPATHSMTGIDFIGKNFLITLNKRGPALELWGVTGMNFSGAIWNSGVGGTNDAAIRSYSNIQGFTFNGVVETLGTFWVLNESTVGATVNCTISNPTNVSAPVIQLDPTLGTLVDCDLTFTLGNTATRNLLDITGTVYGDTILGAYVKNTKIKTNQTFAYAGLDQNLLFNANTKNVDLLFSDRHMVIGDHTAEIDIPSTLVGTSAGTLTGAVCKVIMPAMVGASAAGALSVELEGMVSNKVCSTGLTAANAIKTRQQAVTLYTNGTIFLSDSNGGVAGSQADVIYSGTAATQDAVNAVIGALTGSAVATGVASIAFHIDTPNLVINAGGGDTGKVYFSGKARMNWAGFLAQAPLLTLP